MFNQPKGLISLASTEMWERFSFYTMQYSLVLYAAAEVSKGGLGFSESHALKIVGIYSGIVYAAPILGGYVADKYLGRLRTIHLGGILMAIGQFLLAFGSQFSLYLSIAFLSIGCGFFKPNITSLVGNLYTKNDSRRDAGYNIFYSAINIGALIAGIFGGILNETVGYYASFLLAGFCMLIGITNFMYFSKTAKNLISDHKTSFTKPKSVPFQNLKQDEKNGIYLFLFLCAINIVWQIAYNQWAGSLNLFADRNMDRVIYGFKIPTLWYESLNPLFIILISPLFAYVYSKLSERNIHIGLSSKLSLGYFLQSLACFAILPALMHLRADSSYLSSPLPLVLFYFLSTLAELFTMPVMFSATSMLAPAGYEGRLMGIFIFSSLSAGSYLAGYVASKMTHLGNIELFLALGTITAVFGFICIVLNKKINLFFKLA